MKPAPSTFCLLKVCLLSRLAFRSLYKWEGARATLQTPCLETCPPAWVGSMWGLQMGDNWLAPGGQQLPPDRMPPWVSWRWQPCSTSRDSLIHSQTFIHSDESGSLLPHVKTPSKHRDKTIFIISQDSRAAWVVALCGPL